MRIPRQSKLTAPRSLSSAARRFWTEVQADYGIDDAAGRALLQCAAEALDQMAAARRAIAKDGMFPVDRFGAARKHPAIAVEQAARGQFLKSLAALNLDIEPLRDHPGRPIGTYAGATRNVLKRVK